MWLNSETSIQYPVAFGAKERRVFVQGEAYFEVAKDANKPFTVQFMSSSVTVLGTSFNIRAYPEENSRKLLLQKVRENTQPWLFMLVETGRTGGR